jgi:hypothetical protein
VSANHIRLIAYGFCFLISIIVGGAAASVAGLAFGARGQTVAGAFCGGFLGTMGIGSQLIGPFGI